VIGCVGNLHGKEGVTMPQSLDVVVGL
jgi:hypothetical protein